MSSTNSEPNLRHRSAWWQKWPIAFLVVVVAFIIFCFVRAAVVPPPSRVSMTDPASGVGFEPQLGDNVPLDIELRNEAGETVQLRDYFGKRPVVLSLVYYECPMLCGQVMNGLVRSLRALKYDIGDEYSVLTVSFDPREGPELARQAKETAVGIYSRPGAEDGWHFLTGDETQVRRLADAVGFRYRWDEPTQQYVHGAGIMLLDENGKQTHYFNGIEYPARDIELGLVSASEGDIGTLADRAVLLCYHYDPAQAGFAFAVWNIVRILCVLSLIVLIASFVCMNTARKARWRRELAKVDRPALAESS